MCAFSLEKETDYIACAKIYTKHNNYLSFSNGELPKFWSTFNTWLSCF